MARGEGASQGYFWRSGDPDGGERRCGRGPRGTRPDYDAGRGGGARASGGLWECKFGWRVWYCEWSDGGLRQGCDGGGGDEPKGGCEYLDAAGAGVCDPQELHFCEGAVDGGGDAAGSEGSERVGVGYWKEEAEGGAGG